MTMPILPPINWDEWCCADLSVGGCGHRVFDDHNRSTGRCQAAGCPCTQPRTHTPTCVHMLIEVGE